MEVRAKHSYILMSPQKLRLVCDKVRGLQAEQALAVLEFMPQKGAYYVSKTLKSALANAENNMELDTTEMYIDEIFADEGPRLRRYKAGARGRYKPRKRRMAHLTIVLKTPEEEV